MPPGRPPKEHREALPQLAEISKWFNEALASAGYKSVHQFIQNSGLEKNSVYEVMNGTRFTTLDSLKRLALALNSIPEEVEPIWLRAKYAMERDAQRRAASSIRLPSWADIPRPDPHIENVLLAQATTAEMLPYSLLGLEAPLLPAIYVPQFVRRQTRSQNDITANSDQSTETERRDTPLPVMEAVSSVDHILITGGPGAGKSIFTQELTRRLARIWLRDDPATVPPVEQPVIPLRIPARALGQAGSFSLAVATAVREVYGFSMVTEPEAELFSRSAHGARWLLLIDGIDEIVDSELRNKLIRAIAGHAHNGAPYRFIVTSRPLAGELAPLRQSGFISYSVEPFGQTDLRLFAKRWFIAQNADTAEEKAASFIHEILDGRLRDAASNPLLATIAAVAKTQNPVRPLPSSRIDLYGWFCEYLIQDTARRRAILNEARRHLSEQGYQKAEWVLHHIQEILEYLAEQHLTTEAPSLETAQAWIDEKQPSEFTDVALSDGDLHGFLTSTGLLVAEGPGLRFLHRAFTEYLAARAHAARLPPEVSDIRPWVERGREITQRSLVLFTLVLWSRKGPGLGPLLRKLLHGPPRHLLFAGQLLGDCGHDTPSEATEVVDRLMDLALGTSALMHADHLDDDSLLRSPFRKVEAASTEPDEVFWTLGRIRGDSFTIRRLREVATRSELSGKTRALAALALGRAASPDEGVATLEAVAEENFEPSVLALIAELMISLQPESPERACTVLEEISFDPSDWELSPIAVRTADLLMRIGRARQACNIAWPIVKASQAYPRETLAAVRIILAVDGPGAVTELLKVAHRWVSTGRSSVRWILVELVDFGAREAVVRFCAQEFSSDHMIPWQFSSVAGAWVMAAGPSAVGELSKFLGDRGSAEAEAYLEVALRLMETGYPAESFRIAIDILKSPEEAKSDGWMAAHICLTTSSPETLPEVLALIDNLAHAHASDSSYRAVMERLEQLGDTDRATRMARSLLEGNQFNDARAISSALRILKASSNLPSLIENLVHQAEHTESGSQRARLVEVVAELGGLDWAAEEARKILTDSLFWVGDEISRAIKVLILSEGSKATLGVLALMKQRNHRTLRQSLRTFVTVGDTLAILGGLRVSREIWLDQLTDLSLTLTMNFRSCSLLVQSGNREMAISALREALTGTRISASDHARLGALLSWAILRDPNADLHSQWE